MKRIRKSYKKAEITLFCDLNPDSNFTAELVERTLKLKPNIQNKNIITREQERLDKRWISTLDFFFSTGKIQKLVKLDKNESDHYPLLSCIQLNNKTTKTTRMIKYHTIWVNDETIKCILDNEQWPTKSDFNLNRKTLFKRTVIWPTIKIQQDSNNIF